MNKTTYDIAYIRRYINGELSYKQMFDLERMAHEDEMLMDMIIGVEFEKSNQLSHNITEIHHRIQQRTKQSSKTKIAWSRWAIAASLIGILGISALFFWQQQTYIPKEEQISLSSPKRNSDPIIDNKIIDSNLNATDLQISQIDSKSKLPDIQTRKKKISAPKPNPLLAAAKDSNIIAYHKRAAHIELSPTVHSNFQQALQSKKSVLTEEKLIVPPPYHIDSTLAVAATPVVQQLAGIDRKVKVDTRFEAASPAQLRAKLSGLNLDPQTNNMLNQVIQNKEIEQKNSHIMKNGESNVINIQPDEEQYSHLARIKTDRNNRSATKNTTDDVKSVSLNLKSITILTKSSPIGGWKAFDNYLGEALDKYGFKSGKATLEFELNPQGEPESIKVLNQTNKKIIRVLIRILQEGPAWEVGQDAAQMSIDVKF